MEHENSEAQFKVEYTRIGPVTFNITVITPDGTKFTTVGQANPDQLTKESILQNFRDRNNWDKWICELEEIKPIIKEEEISAPESNVQPAPPIQDLPDGVPVTEVKDTVIASL